MHRAGLREKLWSASALVVTATAGGGACLGQADGLGQCRVPANRTVDCCAGSACATAVPDAIRVDPAHNLARAAETGLSGLDESLEEIRRRFKIPALAAAVWQGGRITAAAAVGVRVAGAPVPVAITDRFHIGSCGKAMTATLAGILVERGIISWSTTVEDVFPGLAGGMHEAYRGATLHQLLSHRGGFPQARPPGLLDLEGPLPAQRRALVGIAGGLEPVGMPGATFHYTDLGYCVAGAMLEQVTATSWEALIVEYLAEPLGISLGFGAPGAGSAPASEPWGHVLRGDAFEGVAPGPGADGAVPALGPAGTIHASITDWAAFAALHIDGRGSAAEPLLGRADLELLHADPYRQGYALGWGLQQIDGRVDLVHSGSCGRWAALVRVIPEREMAIVAASNYGGPSAFEAVGEAIEVLAEQYGAPR